METTVKKIFIVGYYGYRNTGDDAMLLGLVKALHGNPKCRFVLEHYSNGNSLKDTIKRILQADIVILGGGTHLRNWGQGWFKQSVRIVAAAVFIRLLGKKFHMLNVGIDGKAWEWLAKLIANIVTIRDKDTFDSSVLIEFNQQKQEKILGIALTPVHGIYHNNMLKDQQMVNQITNGVKKWLGANRDWKVKFFSFNGSARWEGGDDAINNNTTSLVSGAQFVAWQPDVVKTIEEVSKCSAFIGMRYHSCLFAYMTRTPLIVVETYPSCRALAQFIGVNTLTMKQVLSGNFELKFDNAKLPVEQAKKLATKGIVL